VLSSLTGRVRWISYQSRGIATCPELTTAGKVAMLLAKLRYHTGLLRRDQIVDCGAARIKLGRKSFSVDWRVFLEVFVARLYEPVRFERASVLDLGAHKGYFAVFALNHGAAWVVSYEPEEENYRRLAAAAAPVPQWTTHRKAIARETGVRVLSIRDAWSHRLDSGDAGGVHVQALALRDVLTASRGERQVVKLDIEGAECEALASAPRDLLARVDELIVEAHPEAGCEVAAILALTDAAGLRRIEGPTRMLHFRPGRDVGVVWPRRESRFLTQGQG
jgi:FkbM family methyltransferase